MTASANCLVYGLTNQSVTLKKWTFQAHCKHNYRDFLSGKNTRMISDPAPFLTMNLCKDPDSQSSHLRQAEAPMIQAGARLICNGNFSALLWLSYNGARRYKRWIKYIRHNHTANLELILTNYQTIIKSSACVCPEYSNGMSLDSKSTSWWISWLQLLFRKIHADKNRTTQQRKNKEQKTNSWADRFPT